MRVLITSVILGLLLTSVDLVAQVDSLQSENLRLLIGRNIPKLSIQNFQTQYLGFYYKIYLDSSQFEIEPSVDFAKMAEDIEFSKVVNALGSISETNKVSPCQIIVPVIVRVFTNNKMNDGFQEATEKMLPNSEFIDQSCIQFLKPIIVNASYVQ